jgi:hypothetical protein
MDCAASVEVALQIGLANCLSVMYPIAKLRFQNLMKGRITNG